MVFKIVTEFLSKF